MAEASGRLFFMCVADRSSSTWSISTAAKGLGHSGTECKRYTWDEARTTPAIFPENPHILTVLDGDADANWDVVVTALTRLHKQTTVIIRTEHEQLPGVDGIDMKDRTVILVPPTAPQVDVTKAVEEALEYGKFAPEDDEGDDGENGEEDEDSEEGEE